MKTQINENIQNGTELERLYQQDETGFKKAFDEVHPQISYEPGARFWHESLHFQRAPMLQVNSADFIFVAILCLLAGFVVFVFPLIFGIN